MNISAPPTYFNDSILQINNNTFGRAALSCSSGFAGETEVNKKNKYGMSAATMSATDDSGAGGGAKSNMTPLPLDFVPGDFDVLCGRGKKNYNSMGKLLSGRLAGVFSCVVPSFGDS